MKKNLLRALLLTLCILMCFTSCSKNGGEEDSSGTTDSESTSGQNTDNTGDDGDGDDEKLQLPGDLVDPNFAGLEAKSYDDVNFSFIDEGATRVLKQERIAFADSNSPTRSGKVWDSAASQWTSASDITTSVRKYEIPLKGGFENGTLALNFQFKREGGEKQCFVISPKGYSLSQGAVYFENDNITVGEYTAKQTSAYLNKIKIPAGEWCFVKIEYSTTWKNELTVSVAVTDEYGSVIGSLHTEAKSIYLKEISSMELIDLSAKNIADCGVSVPIYTTSVWYMKNLSIESNPMETGDKIKLKYDTFTSNKGYEVNFLSLNSQQTMRPYFGMYSILSDNSGFLCGTGDGRFYLYDIQNQELTYLDKANSNTTHALPVYLNRTTDNVFYAQYDSKIQKSVIHKINIHTFEKSKVYEVPKELSVSLEVTNDEKYTCYTTDGWCNANEITKMGRVNLETGALELERQVSYSSEYCVNHFALNPTHPELLLFHRERDRGTNEKDHTNVMNLETGVLRTYEQPGDNSAHAMWTLDGEYITVTDYVLAGTQVTILSKDLSTVNAKVIKHANHAMADSSRTWVCGDGLGISLMNMNTGESVEILNDLQITDKGHPFHGHAEISADGKLLLWGQFNDEGVLGIAWIKNPNITN